MVRIGCHNSCVNSVCVLSTWAHLLTPRSKLANEPSSSKLCVLRVWWTSLGHIRTHEYKTVSQRIFALTSVFIDETHDDFWTWIWCMTHISHWSSYGKVSHSTWVADRRNANKRLGNVVPLSLMCSLMWSIFLILSPNRESVESEIRLSTRRYGRYRKWDHILYSKITVRLDLFYLELKTHVFCIHYVSREILSAFWINDRTSIVTAHVLRSFISKKH